MATDLSMMTAPMRREENCLLAVLPVDVRDRMRSHLERVALPRGKVLYEPGDATKGMYFPCDCIVSGVYTLEDGHSGEISLVGNDGIVGIDVLLGVIEYRRGRITVLDRARLEQEACECYHVVKKEADRLFPEADLRTDRVLRTSS